MAEISRVTFEGNYKFTAYTRDTRFNPVGAVYILTRRDLKGSHTPIYVGETGNLSERFSSHHRQSCIDNNGANCICILREENAAKRLRIEYELRKRYNPICNKE